MDAYSNYIKQLSDARVGDLRREAEAYRLSASARLARRTRWETMFRRLVRKRRPALPPLHAPPQAWASSSKPSSR